MLIKKGKEIILKKMNTDPVKAAFGTWCGKIKESSVEYVRKLRSKWRKR